MVTDHRPLVALLSKPLDEVMNARILRMRERLANFTFNVTWQAGKIHDIADALSRAPVFAARNQEDGIAIKAVDVEDPGLMKLLEAADDDEVYQHQLAAINQNVSNQ